MMIEEAKRQIKECLLNKEKKLNLSVNLNEVPELQYCIHLEFLGLMGKNVKDISILSSLTNITQLIIGSTEVSDLAPLENLFKLNSLFIATSKIRDLTPLKNLRKLTHLNLPANLISDVSPLYNLTDITSLRLSGNQISDISSLQNLNNLQVLDLSGNRIFDITPLKYLKNLVVLNLSENQISDISPLESLINLKELNLQKNVISDISPLKHLHILSKLNLSKNQIVEINALENQINLSTLNISNNHFDGTLILPMLHNLTDLDLSENRIEDIRDLGNLNKLTKLNLYKNQIQDISPLQNLIHLINLNLSFNLIKDISTLKHLKNITNLEIYHNEISDITSLQFLTDLNNLEIDNNQITDLKPLENLTKLSGLDLSYNKIKNLEPLRNLINLITLKLSHNQFLEIKPLEKLNKLTELDLDDNKISDFSPLLNILTYQEDQLIVDTHNCPNESINQAVGAGYEALKNYYDELKRQGAIPTDQLKVMILGNSTAGKTSLVKYWGNKSFDEKQVTTHGIYTPMDLPFIYESEASYFRVNVWDFGGQDYYHATHRLFITNDSIFIIVYAKELESQHLPVPTKEYILVNGEVTEIEIPVQHYPYSYWLQTLTHLTHAEHQNNKMPLFLIENKCGLYGDDDNDTIRLSASEKRNIPFDIIGKDFYHLDIKEAWKYAQNPLENIESAAHYSAYQKFEKKLIETLQNQIDHNQYEVIAYFPEVRKTLEELARFKQHEEVSENLNQLLTENKIKPLEKFTKLPVWITYEEYEDIVKRARKVKENEEEIPWNSLRIYLQNLCGRIFHFSHIPALKDIVFIDPVWLHETIYKVLGQQVVLEQKGEFTLQQADEVIDGNIIEAGIFLEAMKDFELIFEIPNQSERRFIAPQYLPTECPISKAQLEKLKTQYHQLALVLEFPEYLPSSLISRIISLKGHLIVVMEEPLWKYGVVYSENDISTLIQCKPETKTIEIYLSKSITDDQTKSVLRAFMQFMEKHFSADLHEMFVVIPGIGGKVKWKHLYAGKRSGIYGAKNYEDSENSHMLSTEKFSFLLPDFTKSPVRFFLCYSHEDQPEMEIFQVELARQLRSFEVQNNISIELFTDLELQPGDHWHTILEDKIRENDILLCLLSSVFFSSKYIHEHEYGKVIQEIAIQKRDTLIVPIHFKASYISDLNSIYNIQFFNPAPREFGLSAVDNFSFCNLLAENRNDLITNYVTKLIKSLERKIHQMWNKQKV